MTNREKSYYFYKNQNFSVGILYYLIETGKKEYDAGAKLIDFSSYSDSYNLKEMKMIEKSIDNFAIWIDGRDINTLVQIYERKKKLKMIL